uniref:Uncharacterized protein n=1 Tax=Rhizophora mucronata TaxID=61149 RepID=A0A2P2MYU6_RHIMU
MNPTVTNNSMSHIFEPKSMKSLHVNWSSCNWLPVTNIMKQNCQ